MKVKYRIRMKGETVEREYSYIPLRYILAILLAVFEILTVIGIVVALCYYVPYFYIAAAVTQVCCVLSVIGSHDNPDYKVPWLLCLMLLPVAGFMLYLMFYSRKLKPKFVRRLKSLKALSYQRDDALEMAELEKKDPAVASLAKMLRATADTRVFANTKQTYYPIGENMHTALLQDLKTAQSFIYIEYFIIEGGVFWDSILTVLKEKAAAGVEVKLVYDDIGCMGTLPGNYFKTLKKYRIEALPFSILRGSADSEFNNRSHRKITVIDGRVGYTGGINLADEYINEIERFGHWKDTAIRLEGEAVWELTRLFLSDFALNAKGLPALPENAYPHVEGSAAGYVIPFGDGPRPIYPRRVGKSVILHMLNTAVRYVYMTTPYLIIDNDVATAIENAALRGVDVRILLPHIPDKKLVFTMSHGFYHRLLDAGARIFEYEPGFLHAKSYLADGSAAMIGTINLDYRSLVHHFENGVFLYECESIRDLEADIEKTLEKCIEIKKEDLNPGALIKILRTVIRTFAPML